jgi:hypothetical protein
VEKAEDDPGADAIRGALSIRRFSTVRRSSRVPNVDPTRTTSVYLPNWQNRTDGGPEWHRESTIREVPAEEDSEQRKSSVQFNPTAPHTHIYPPLNPQKYGDDHIEEVDFSRRGGLHNPLSPVATPDFISAPPTPRYNVRGSVQKTFSFGSGGRKRRTEEETIGLVEAGRDEGMNDYDDKGSASPHSEPTEDSDYEKQDVGTTGRRQRSYDML